MTKTLVYSSSNDEPLVKNSGGNYQVSSMFVGSRITIQPDNLTPRRQYLAHATGEITAIKGNKASVLLDEPSNKSYKSQTIKIDLCSLKLISAQGWEQDSVIQDCNSDSISLESQRLMNTAQASSSCDIPTHTTTATFEESSLLQNGGLGIICTQKESTSSQLRHHAPHFPQKDSEKEQMTSETVSPLSLKSLENCNPNSSPLKMSPACSPAPTNQTQTTSIFHTYSDSLPSAGTMRNGLLSAVDTLPVPSLENGYCWLPSPGALSSTGKGRPPGQTKQEAELKKLGLINFGEVLNPAILCQWYEIPETWLDPSELRAATELLEDSERQQEIFSILELQRSLSEESSTSTRSVAKKSDCWYTPPHIVDLVKRVLGEIDLDPCADDGKHIPAALHYTATLDGLSQEWLGRVFMNPPYSCPGVWINKLQSEVELERVTEAIALVPAATDTNWLSPVLKTQPVCFWKGRIKFLDVNYQPKLPARQSHCLVYWGENWEKFREVFEVHGFVSVPNQFLGDKQTEKISPRKSPETLQNKEKLDIQISTTPGDTSQFLGDKLEDEISPRKIGIESEFLGDKSEDEISPRITRRSKGDGSGSIHWRTSTKKGKDYHEAYYHYEFWNEGDRLTKSTKYIPKRLLGRVQELEAKKAPVREILAVLGVKL